MPKETKIGFDLASRVAGALTCYKRCAVPIAEVEDQGSEGASPVTLSA